MEKRFVLGLIMASVLWTMVSCSGHGLQENIITPESDVQGLPEARSGGVLCLGYWHVTAEKESGGLVATQLRTADLMLNVLSFLEPPPMTGMTLNWSTLDLDFENGKISADVILKHPINDPVFMGFDVRGVVFGPEVVNADGLTPVMAPDDFSSVPFGYTDGLLGAPDSHAHYSEVLNGYKYFCDDLGTDEDLVEFFSESSNVLDRGSFPNGSSLSRHYDLEWPGTGYDFLEFNYAIYANYDWPVGGPPIDIDDFPIETANSQEAFCCCVVELENTLFSGGGQQGGDLSLQIGVWDWQDNIGDITIESLEPGSLIQTSYTSCSPNAVPHSSLYDFIDCNFESLEPGDMEILITVKDEKTFGESWFLDLMSQQHQLYDEPVYACWLYSITVTDCPLPIPTNISIDRVLVGSIHNVVEIGGTFLDGPELGTKLVLGVNEIQGTNLVFVNQTSLTCDFDFIDAQVGDWDLFVINGCGTVGSLEDAVTIVGIAENVGNLTLEVLRDGNNKINGTSNIRLTWDPVTDAEEYLVYADEVAMDGSFSLTEFKGSTDQTELLCTLYTVRSAVYTVRARSIQDEPLSESDDSELAFVDLEAQGSFTLPDCGAWFGQYIYDGGPYMQWTNNNSTGYGSGHRCSFSTPSSAYCNRYTIIRSEPYPEIDSANTYRLEVVGRFNYLQPPYEGAVYGYLTVNYSDGVIDGGETYPFFRTSPIISGLDYITSPINGIADEFPLNGHSDRGFNQDNATWYYSVADISAIALDAYDTVAIGIANDSYIFTPNRYVVVDEIAVIVY